MWVKSSYGLWRLGMTLVSLGAAGFSSVGASLEPAPATLARQQCEAAGRSDGETATALGWCLHRSDGGLTGPGLGLDCDELTYELAVADDSELAVFPGSVVRNYRPAGATVEGSGNDEGTIINVSQVPYEPGAPAPSPTYDRPLLVAENLDIGSRLFSATGRWWNRTCWTQNADDATSGTVEGPFGEGAVVRLSDLLAVAVARVTPPPLPPARHAGPASITQLATWFWIDAPWWEADYSDTARHGLVAVTVEATPSAWSLAPVGPSSLPLLLCEHGGIDYRAGGESLACTATFTRPPPGGVLDLRAEATLDLQWRTTLPGYGIQVLSPMFRSSVISHSVVEVAGLRSG